MRIADATVVVTQRRLATERARAVLGFEASVPLREGIPEVVDWYRRHAGAI